MFIKLKTYYMTSILFVMISKTVCQIPYGEFGNFMPTIVHNQNESTTETDTNEEQTRGMTDYTDSGQISDNTTEPSNTGSDVSSLTEETSKDITETEITENYETSKAETTELGPRTVATSQLSNKTSEPNTVQSYPTTSIQSSSEETEGTTEEPTKALFYAVLFGILTIFVLFVLILVVCYYKVCAKPSTSGKRRKPPSQGNASKSSLSTRSSKSSKSSLDNSEETTEKSETSNG